MPYITVKLPPGSTVATASSTYVPPDVRRVFKALLDSIPISDERHGMHTPTPTLELIQAAASQLGVPPGELVNDEDE